MLKEKVLDADQQWLAKWYNFFNFSTNQLPIQTQSTK